ncbi:MAG: 2-phosphosulfolactate phosphatase [Marinilabiliales bacterium]|nr:2-phosphosulfolactate phosphatase [Marinilabiliales bacterium]
MAYSTTNGTGIMKMASECHDVVIGCLPEHHVRCAAGWKSSNRKVIIVCAGWKKRFSLEDALCAGAIAARLLESGRFTTGATRCTLPRIYGKWQKDDLTGLY